MWSIASHGFSALVNKATYKASLTLALVGDSVNSPIY